MSDNKFHFAIDRGGTFTDLHCLLPDGGEVVRKLLSVDPSNYCDAPVEGIRRILNEYDSPPGSYPRNGPPLRTDRIGSVRMATTVATNALLERDGERVGLLITSGFRDLLEIGDQSRPDIFDLSCKKPGVLYEMVEEIDERVAPAAHFFAEGVSKGVDGKENEERWRDGGEIVKGVTGEDMFVLKKPDPADIRKALDRFRDKGIRSIAVVFAHSYEYDAHEQMVKSIIDGTYQGPENDEDNVGYDCFVQVSLSSEIMPVVRMVGRGCTAVCAAYLTPVIDSYLRGFAEGFDCGDDIDDVTGDDLRRRKKRENEKYLRLGRVINLSLMKSDGGLTPAHGGDFIGHRAVLSGPAGGVVGYARTAYDNPRLSVSGTMNKMPVIGFDMGGTSTDVSRYDGRFAHVSETTTAGVKIFAPQLDIETVAAGGGSILSLLNGMFTVGPKSSGAHPGPACYRKGGKAPTVTDANLVLGRLMPERFPKVFGPNEDEALDTTGSVEAFQKLILEEGEGIESNLTVEEVAYGFLRVANEAMCRPIRNLTNMKGHDVESHRLACFGGAGPQHACAMAKALGIKKVFIHRHGGILSAYGLSLADAVKEEQEPSSDIYLFSQNDQWEDNSTYNKSNGKYPLSSVRGRDKMEKKFAIIGERAALYLVNCGYRREEIILDKYLNMRYSGTDTAIMIRESFNDDNNLVDGSRNHEIDGNRNCGKKNKSDFDYAGAFRSRHLKEFGFDLTERDLLVDDYRVRAVVKGGNPPTDPSPTSIRKLETPSLTHNSSISMLQQQSIISANETTRAYFEAGWVNDVPVYDIEQYLLTRSKGKDSSIVYGPALMIQNSSTVVLEVGCTAVITADGNLDISVSRSTSNTDKVAYHGKKDDGDRCECTPFGVTIGTEKKLTASTMQVDSVSLSIFSHRFMGIAEQMGHTLQRTCISVNLKERLDYSCALFDQHGGLVANAPHIPVHLGAMQVAVKFQISYWNGKEQEGINDGDVLVSNHPQLAGGSHLPDITVITPIMYDNKIIFFVASRGHHADIGGISPGSMPPHSTKLEDEGAMIVAFKLVKDGHFQEEGITELLQSPGKIPGNYGTRNLNENLNDLRAQVASNNSGIQMLHQLVTEHSLETVQAYMGYIQQNAELTVRSMLKNFAMEHGGRSVFASDGMDDGTRIELKIDVDMSTGDAIFDFTGTGQQVLGNHNAPPSVTYSAVIYSLRCIVGMNIPLNQGCLTPVTFIIPKFCLLNPSDDAAVVGGNVLTSQRVVDVVLKAFGACAASQGCMNNLSFGDKSFGYYETIAGGAGAGKTWHGCSGVHTHCTNTRITDPEILEKRYPVLLRKFCLRKGSGGSGKFRGGDGVVRVIEPLRPLTMSILSERRTLRPYGLYGGEDGKCGRNLLIKKNGISINIGGKCSILIASGDQLQIETPGGGGFGVVEK